MKNLAYLVALHSVDGLGPIRLKLLLDYFKDPKFVWGSGEKELEELGLPRNALQNLLESRKTLDPEKYLTEIFNLRIKILTIFDENYPKSLKQIYDPPIILYYKGDVLPQDQKAIGVVGTRKMTGYGKAVTQKFTSDLVHFGFTIISGLARGVDTTSHAIAVAEQGRTLAVLGGGLNRLFPPENTHLADQIINGQGALLSEFPPDAASMPGNFPSRNRIIAGLVLGVLVTEAAQDSGSLITARLALEQGKEVFAVPGPITSTQSDGTAQLIKQGAKLVLNVEDILEELGMEKNVNYESKIMNYGDFSEDEQKILNCLENEQKQIDEIVRESKLASPQVSSSLIKLEIMGVVRNLGGGNYVKSF